MPSPILEMRSVEHTYAGRSVLHVDNLPIDQGAIVGLVGRNGSGKSTLLRILGLIEKPSRGQVLFRGRPAAPFCEWGRFDIALLPQEPCLLKRSVFKNVSYGLKLRGISCDRGDRVTEALSHVGLALDVFGARPWYALSGGEAQRVALASRLALRPKVLLLDEPTANVDSSSAQLIKEAALRAREQWGVTVVVSSHDRQWLYEVCDKVLYLLDGKIFFSAHKALVFGPWQSLANGGWGKPLPDGQVVEVPPPPHETATALIEPISMTDRQSPEDPDKISLRGVVSRLTLEKHTDHILTKVVVSGLSFTLAIPSRQVNAQAIMPGKAIYVYYSLGGIQWV